VNASRVCLVVSAFGRMGPGRGLALVLCALVATGPRVAQAHDVFQPGAVVIDTDMGLDDTVALALALQHPHLDLQGLVVTPGAMGSEQAATYAERLLSQFNRSDVDVFLSPATATTARTQAANYVGPALNDEVPKRRRPATPAAYVGDRAQTTVVALGPLTTLAAALHEDPSIASRIRRIVIAGLPERRRNWNLQLDPDAYDIVRESGIDLSFVAPGKGAVKPSDWNLGRENYGPGTSVGERFLRVLLSRNATREHYLDMLDRFTDELPILYLARPQLFSHAHDTNGTLTPSDDATLLAYLRRALLTGRQARTRTIFKDGPLPAAALRPEIAAVQQRVIEKHGETEWFAQLLLNETHQHVGAYSIIGVKMGLHAAELLNAPQHGMQVVARTPPQPPVCCLNDGVIVATGCTPGRALFRLEPSTEPGATSVTFRYNGREVTLRLKPAYQQQIRTKIRSLLDKYSLEDDAYWAGVEQFATKAWEDWHRSEIFELIADR
jgi:inosine-uridine nucleoside N-ribohydrolase/formylmethanofuran dehydrogenase subunit E